MPSFHFRNSLSHIVTAAQTGHLPPQSLTPGKQQRLALTLTVPKKYKDKKKCLSGSIWMPGLNSGPTQGTGSVRSSQVSVLPGNHIPLYGTHDRSFTAQAKDLVYTLFTLLFPERQLAQRAFYYSNSVINDKLNNIQGTFLIKTAREPLHYYFLPHRNVCCDS